MKFVRFRVDNPPCVLYHANRTAGFPRFKISVFQRGEKSDSQPDLPERVRASHILIKASSSLSRQKATNMIKAGKMQKAIEALFKILREKAEAGA